MRAAATSAYVFTTTCIGLALGPYTVGKISAATGSLRQGLLFCTGANVLAVLFFVLAMRHFPRDQASRLERARALGEPAEATSPL